MGFSTRAIVALALAVALALSVAFFASDFAFAASLLACSLAFASFFLLGFSTSLRALLSFFAPGSTVFLAADDFFFDATLNPAFSMDPCDPVRADHMPTK